MFFWDGLLGGGSAAASRHELELALLSGLVNRPKG